MKILASKNSVDKARQERVALAADDKSKQYFKYARAIHDKLYSKLLANFVQQVKPDAQDRFKNPELDVKPTTLKGGGNVYSVYSALKDFALSVELSVTAANVGLKGRCCIMNPYSTKAEAVVDWEAAAECQPEEFEKNHKQLLNACVHDTMAVARAQVKEDGASLAAQLSNLKGQLKFYGALSKAFQLEEKELHGDKGDKEITKSSVNDDDRFTV